MDCVGDEIRKRQKNSTNTEGSNRGTVTLGSLNLVQFEEIKKRSDAILLAQQEQDRERCKEKVEADLDVVMKMQEIEEKKARQKALKAQDEKKDSGYGGEKAYMMELVHKQQTMIARCVEKIERWEERERERWRRSLTRNLKIWKRKIKLMKQHICGACELWC